jgi:tetratricopeptide (TPR) repeat protein
MDRPFPAYKGDEPYIFVSYAHKNATEVYSELSWLHDLGFNIWYDEGIEAGTEWREELGHAIKESSVFLYLVTPQSQESENCRNELNFAADEQVPILAVHLSPTELSDGLKLTLSGRQAILKHDISKHAYQEKLHTRLVTYLDSPTGVVTETPRKAGNRFLPIAIGVFALLALGLFYLQQNPWKPLSTAEELQAQIPSELPSIIVLPLKVFNEDKEVNEFTEGLGLEILDKLGGLTEMGIRLEQREHAPLPIENDEAESLQLLLKGSVRSIEKQLRINLQIVNLTDQTQFSESYSEPLNSTFDTQSRIAQHIKGRISALVQRYYIALSLTTEVEEAKFNFLKAYDEFNKIVLSDGGDEHTHVAFLEAAIEADPDFLEAHLWLINAHTWRIYPIEKSLPAARLSVRKVLARDISNLPPSVSWLKNLFIGKYYFLLELNYQAAKEHFEKQLAVTPDDGEFISRLADIDFREGRINEAQHGMQRAINVTNLALVQVDWWRKYARVLNTAGEFDKALDALNEAIIRTAQPGRYRSYWLLAKSTSHYSLGDLDAAKQALDLAMEQPNADQQYFPYMLARIGRTQEAKHLLVEIEDLYESNTPEANGRHVGAGAIFQAYYSLGEMDVAFAWLERAINERDTAVLDNLRTAAFLEPLRQDSRYPALLAKLESMETHTNEYLRKQD